MIPPDILQKVLLACGIFGVLLYIGTDILAGTRWKGYSFRSQSSSVLRAFGASTRSLVVPLDLVYGLLIFTFGAGIWRTAVQEPLLRVAAVLIAGNAALTTAASLFFPMHPGEAANSPANIRNLIPMATAMVFFVLAILFGGLAHHNGFRIYSFATLLTYLVLTIFGVWIARRIPEELRTPTVGVQERTMIFFYLLWLVVLAVLLLQADKGQISI